MPDHDKNVPFSLPGGPSDLLSLDAAMQAPRDSGAGASSQDSILNTAEMFQAQLDQMTTWKHTLAQQMEVMRRDGIKLLERQKNLAIEKKRAGEERESLATERTRIQQLQHDLDAQTRRLTQRAADLESSHAELQKLKADKDHWERELHAARTEVESLAARKSVTASELAAAEARLNEIRALESRRDELFAQISEGEKRLLTCDAERRAIEAAHHEVDLRQAELTAAQKTLNERQNEALAEDHRLKEGLEQVERERRALADAQSQSARGHESLRAEQQKLVAAQHALDQRAHQLAARDESVRAAQVQLENAQLSLATQQSDLAARDRALAEKTRVLENDLQMRLAQAEKLHQQTTDERDAVLAQRRELQQKLDALDNELAEQLDSLAKQTKRLTERRGTIEAAERDLDKALETRIAAATNALRGELSDTRATYEQRLAALEQQIAASHAAAESLHAREGALQRDLTQANSELARLQDEILNVSALLEDAKDKNTTLARDLAAEIERAKSESAQWQTALDAAKSTGASNDDALQQAHAATAAATAELDAAKSKLKSLQTAHEELQFQLELQTEETGKQLKALQSELAQQLAQRDQEIAEWKQKYQTALTAAPQSAPDGDLQKQLHILEQQRTDLAQQLFAVQDELRLHQDEFRRQQEDFLLAKNGLEGKLFSLQQQNDTLEAEKSAWHVSQSRAASAPALSLSQLSSDAARQISAHRQRLLHKARTLRAFRQQIDTVRGGLEKNREDLAQQREQLRARKENLEQVKRLLEKQEMVMARKLANHNAIKTVAAVGIFVIMILIGAFAGVYQFVHPVYRSEALVKLAPPQENLAGPALDAWIKTQTEFLRSPAVTSAAWKQLRSGDEHYGMHDVREEWLNSLTRHLSVDAEASTNTMFIRYSGPDATGVSQVCNALAAAYTIPTLREPADQNPPAGLGSQTLAKATVPLSPTEDNRMMISLGVVAAVLFVSLLLVMLFRHFVARQLREIDQMADAQDLDDMQSDLNTDPGASPAT